MTQPVLDPNATVAEVRKAWIDALLSGEFQQGLGALRFIGHDRTSRMCCLGVLCHIVDPTKWKQAPTSTSVNAVDYIYDSQYCGIPPKWVTDRAGITKVGQFTDMNDVFGFSFRQIADYISQMEESNEQTTVP